MNTPPTLSATASATLTSITVHRRSQVVVDGKKRRLSDQTAAEGRYLLMDVHFSPILGQTIQQSAHERITAVDHTHHRIAWVTAVLPRWLLNTERWQALTVTAEGGTRYESVVVFYGALGYVVKWLLGKRLMQGFDSTSAGLKERAEDS